MRKSFVILISVVLLATTVSAYAELQNVQVGGQLRMQGDWYDLHNNANSNASVQMRTRLNVRADFTDSVSAFIELDSYDIWGEDLRSSYLTGVDSRSVSTNDVEIYQAYVEANEMWGTALKARVGRQEIKLGSGWLVGTNDNIGRFTGLSFDAIRLTYATDQFSVDALAAKLFEQSPMQEDGDIDLYGVYGSYKGIENISLDAYWLFVRNAAIMPGSLDTHTFGLRGAGTAGALDFEAEAAYQYVDWDTEHHCGDPKDSSDAWAGNLEVGYTFDMNYTPRVFLGGAAFEGSTDDLPFDRLFSNWRYSYFLDNMANLTNMWTGRAGVSAMPTENLKAKLIGAYLSRIEDFCGEADLGWELQASLTYNYTQDLAIEVGYAHFFTGDALGCNVDDFDYGYLETKLSF
jgi:hypothetical protein